jgi:hypothetical protein
MFLQNLVLVMIKPKTSNIFNYFLSLMEERNFLDDKNWFHHQAWNMHTIYGPIYLHVFPENYKRYPSNITASKVCYLPFIYNNKEVYVNISPDYNWEDPNDVD